MNIDLELTPRSARFTACRPVAAAVQRLRLKHQRPIRGRGILVPRDIADLVVDELERRGHAVISPTVPPPPTGAHHHEEPAVGRETCG